MALTTERQTYLLRLRRRGHSVVAISEMLSVPVSSVQSSLSGAYKKLIQEHEAIEAKQLELERLDEVQSSFYETAIEGDPKAAEKSKVETSFSIAWLDDDQPEIIDGTVIKDQLDDEKINTKS